MNKEKKIILITGTRKGIGRSLSEHYINHNYIVIGCSRGQATIKSANYKHFEIDITDEKSVVKMVRSIKRDFGRIDVLVNNAGIASMNHFITTSKQSVHDVFGTNFIGTFLLTREVTKVMIKQKVGRIVNYTTVASALRLEGEAIYAASKSAVENFTQTVAKEVADFGVTINAIGPNPIFTDLIKAVPEEKIADLIDKQAIKRMGLVDDIINVIDFFIDERSEFITGQVIYLGGVNN